jgi:hypothetical protein
MASSNQAVFRLYHNTQCAFSNPTTSSVPLPALIRHGHSYSQPPTITHSPPHHPFIGLPFLQSGEEPHAGIVAGITPGNPTLVTAVEDERLEFQDGGLVFVGVLVGAGGCWQWCWVGGWWRVLIIWLMQTFRCRCV